MTTRASATAPVTVGDLLDGATPLPVTLLAGAPSPAPIVQVRTAASLDAIATRPLPRGTLVVVAPDIDHALPDYTLDIAVRRAATNGCLALLFAGRDRVPLTVRHLAERSGPVLLGCDRDIDFGELVLLVTERVRGGPGSVLARATAALAVLPAAPGTGVDVDRLLEEVSQALGVRLTLGPPEGPGVAVRVEGRTVRRLDGPALHRDEAAALVLPATAAMVGEILAASARHRSADQLDRDHVLSELLVADLARLEHHADRARRRGVRIDGVHTVVAIEPEQVEVGHRMELFRALRGAGSETIDLDAGYWNTARSEDTFLLVRTTNERPSPENPVLHRGVLALLRHRSDPTPLHVGIGTPHPGAAGLRISTVEARSAVHSARARGVVDTPVCFDASSVTRLLEELGSSLTARSVADELLAPLDALGPARATTAITTLEAWLDARGSLKAVGQQLHLHPNAVAYRIARTAEALETDLTDPEQRFALHLACRIRSRRPPERR